MNIVDAKSLTPFEVELLKQIREIVSALKALKED